MFDICLGPDGTIRVVGRLDAAQSQRAQEFLDAINESISLDMAGLDYISSAGLGVLIKTHKRLMNDGAGLKLIHVNSHINDIFGYSGFDKLFDIETAD